MKEPKRHHHHSHHQHESQSAGMVDPNKKKRGPRKKTVIIIVCVILAIILACGIGAYAYLHSLVGKTNQVNVDQSNLGIEKDYENIVNIALYGIDSATGEGRSDAIIVLTLDKNHNKVKLTSFMRDSYVNIDGHGMDKLTHAYAYGGPELAMKTLNENFGLDISHFVSVDFSSLPQIIDQLGGVDVDLTQEEIDTGSIPNATTPGTQTLNGDQALAYTRIRYASGNDFKRTERQRTVLTALVTKIIKQPASTYPDLISQLAPLLTTNLSTNDILNLTSVYGSYAKQGIRQQRFPLDDDCQGQTIDDVYYLTFDIPTEKEKIDAYIFHDQDPTTTQSSGTGTTTTDSSTATTTAN